MKDLLVNIGHTALAKVLLMVVQFATTTILARTLSADDYGIVGFASVVISLLSRLNGLGISQAVIRSPDIDDKLLNTAASLNLLFSLLAFLFAQLSAPLAGWLLAYPASVPVVRVLAFGFLLAPLGFLPSCLLAREMRFGAQRTPMVIGAIANGAVAVSLALLGWKYWSLVIGSLVRTLVTNGVLHFIRSIPLRWCVDRRSAKNLLSVGFPMATAGVIAFVALNADNFLVGFTMGATTLGYYTLAFTWATIGTISLQEVVHSVLLPKFSQLQNDLVRMRSAYLRTLKVVLYGSALINMALFVVADGFLYHVLGKETSRWLPASSVLHVLCVYGVLRSAVETVGNPLVALGETRILLKATTLAATVEIILLPFIVRHFGIIGASILVTVAYASQNIYYLPFLKVRLGIQLNQVFGIFIPVFLSSIISVLLAFTFDLGNPLEWNVIILRLTIYFVSFAVFHELFSRGSMFDEVYHVWLQILKARAS